MTDDKKTCFVISPIGALGSDIRRRADQILKHVMKPAAEECGYTAIRADEISEPGMITSQVIQYIVDAPLVIADLTGMNPNVFYELAIRHVIRKPLVQIIQKEERLPFDIAGMRTVLVDHTDLDSVEEAKKEIIKQIHAINKKKPGEIESPISVSLEIQALRHSDKPEDRSFADILAVVSDLRSEVASSFALINKLLSTSRETLFQSDSRKLDDLRRELTALWIIIENHRVRLINLKEVAWENVSELQQQIEMELSTLDRSVEKWKQIGLG